MGAPRRRFPGAARHGRLIAFATSGSSGSPPKAVLFTRQALDICARGALEHLHAERGDWCCPLPVWHVGGAMIYLRAGLAGTAVHALEGQVESACPTPDPDENFRSAVVLTRAHAGR